jgi:uncharacterized protein
VATTVVVLADTHIRRGSSRRLPDAVYGLLDEADAVLHAGDVLVPELIHELEGFAPTWAVLGNNDAELFGVLPETVEVELDGVKVAMIHDSGPRQGRPARMKRRFPDADIVVYGHSHDPEDLAGEGGQRLFNPGSPTDRRRQPAHTVGLLELEGGRILRTEIRPV